MIGGDGINDESNKTSPAPFSHEVFSGLGAGRAVDRPMPTATSRSSTSPFCFLLPLAYSALNLFANRFFVAMSNLPSIRQASTRKPSQDPRDFALTSYDEQTRISRSNITTNVAQKFGPYRVQYNIDKAREWLRDYPQENACSSFRAVGTKQHYNNRFLCYMVEGAVATGANPDSLIHSNRGCSY